MLGKKRFTGLTNMVRTHIIYKGIYISHEKENYNYFYYNRLGFISLVCGQRCFVVPRQVCRAGAGKSAPAGDRKYY